MKVNGEPAPQEPPSWFDTVPPPLAEDANGESPSTQKARARTTNKAGAGSTPTAAQSPSPNNGSATTSKPDLVVKSGDRPETVRDLLELLMAGGDIYDRGGVLVRLVQPADADVPIARRLTYNNVIVEAHRYCQPIKY